MRVHWRNRGIGTFGPAVALWGTVLMVLTGCGGGELRDADSFGRGAGRDVVLITVDTLRYDATGFSGKGKGASPWADRLAATGRVFSFAHAHAVVTLPSHASILTGLYPYQHGIRDNAGFVLKDDVPTLAGILSEQGYATGGFVSAFTLDGRFGIGRGFDTYDDRYDGYGRPGFTPPERPGPETVARALEWWDANAGRKRFLWVHLFTPHFPYQPSPEFAARFPDAPYYGDAAMADAELEPLLRRFLEGEDKADRDAVVIYTSDHGESLGEHGERTHGLFAYEATLHIPLIFRASGLVAPGEVQHPVGHVDILPTVLELLGVQVPENLPGRSLLDESRFQGPAYGSYFEALSASLNRGWAPLTGRLLDREKVIRLPVPELYDLSADPEETRNLAGSRSARMRDLLRSIPEPDLAGGESVDSETEAQLRSLGYVSSGNRGQDIPFTVENDPKNLVRYDAMLDKSLGEYMTGRSEEAIRTMQELIREQPKMELAYSHLAFFYTDLGRLAEADRVLASAMAEGVAGESIARKYALNLVRGGDAAAAEKVLSGFSESRNPETQSALGRIAAMRGEFDQAQRRFQKALSIDPTFPVARMDLGILLMTQGRFEQAETSLGQALEQDPYLAEAWNGIGVIRSRRKDFPGAMEAWRKALEIDPRLPDALYNMALAASRVGDRGTALESMERYIGLVEGEERRKAEKILQRIREDPGR